MSAPTTLTLVVKNTGPQDRFPPQYNARIKVILFTPTAASRRGREPGTAQMHQDVLIEKDMTHPLIVQWLECSQLATSGTVLRKEGKVVVLSRLCLS